MTNISITGEHIKLGQALKMSNLVSSGAEAKIIVNKGLVKVNSESENRRGRKLYFGDVVAYNGNEIRIVDGN
jgi:ribosome-associated protein